MPAPLQLSRLPNGHLALQVGDAPVAVQLVRCFPWSHPKRYISLRDAEGKELGLVDDPAALDPASRALLDSELGETGMTFAITAITEIRKELELRCWTVETRQGPRSFQTELDEWPQSLPDGRTLIRDVCGDLYTVDDLEALDPQSRERIWVLLD
jgi:hypothetical protein